MANKSKKAVKAELNELGIPFTTDDYKILCTMLKDALDSVDESPILPEENSELPDLPLIGKPIGIGSAGDPPPALDPESDHPVIKRALKIGMIPEQIAKYTDMGELERYCQLIKPQVTKETVIPKKQIVREGYIVRGEPNQITCIVEMTTARAAHVARCTYDEGQLADFLRHERIDPRTVNSLTFNRCCVPKNNVLVTEITIDYMKE